MGRGSPHDEQQGYNGEPPVDQPALRKAGAVTTSAVEQRSNNRMNSIFRLLIAALIFPFFLVFSCLLAVWSWITEGGPAVAFAAWKPLLYYYDAHIISFTNPRWVTILVRFVQDQEEIHLRLSRGQSREWFWTRWYRRYSDPLFGPIFGLAWGLIALQVVTFVIFHLLGSSPFAVGHSSVMGRLTVLLDVAYKDRGPRTISQWIWIALFLGLLMQLVDQVRSFAMLKACETSYDSILSELHAQGGGLITLKPQMIRAGWIDSTVWETREARQWIREYQDLQHGVGPVRMLSRQPFRHDLLESIGLRVYCFSVTARGLQAKRRPLPASYSLLNLRNTQIVVLDDAIDGSVWSEFTTAHEIGHLRGAGIRGQLIQRCGVILGAASAAAVLWLNRPSWSSNEMALAIFLIPVGYFIWTLLKWWTWDREAYGELCADLYAFSQLLSQQIDRAHKLRQVVLTRALREVIQKLTNGSRPALGGFPSRVSDCAGLVLRILALTWAKMRCGAVPEKWARLARNPPLQFRLPSLLFSGWCVIIGYSTSTGLRGVFLAWVGAMVFARANQATLSKVKRLEDELQLPESN